jgi:hypothetical protein
VTLPANCTGTLSLTCTLDDLPGGSSTSLSYSVMVSQTAVGLITNTASISAAQPDLNLANNTATAVSTIQDNEVVYSIYLPAVSKQFPKEPSIPITNKLPNALLHIP